MAKEFSPEERLLRLIRSKGPRPATVEAAKTQVIKEEAANKSAAMRPAKTPLSPPQSGKNKILRFENLNLILAFLLIGLLTCFVLPFFKTKKDAVETLEEKAGKEKTGAGQIEEEIKRPPFTYFSEGVVGARNVFQPALKTEEPSIETPSEKGPGLEEVKGQLSLIGVIGGDRPQAIIEDKKVQKTYFLNKGEGFDNIEVKEILENKVILIYKDQQFELVL